MILLVNSFREIRQFKYVLSNIIFDYY